MQVIVGLLDVKGREEILRVYSSNKKLDKNIFFSVIVMRIFGFSGADLVNFMNEVVIFVGRRGKDRIIIMEVDDLIDRIVVGMEGIKMIDGKSKMLVVYYEVGYFLCV